MELWRRANRPRDDDHRSTGRLAVCAAAAAAGKARPSRAEQVVGVKNSATNRLFHPTKSKHDASTLGRASSLPADDQLFL